MTEPVRNALARWLRFVESETHVFARTPSSVFQQAFNSALDSPMIEPAAQRLSRGLVSRPWLRRLNRPRGATARVLTLTGHGPVFACAFTPDASIVVAGMDYRLAAWSAVDGALRFDRPIQGNVGSLACSPDGRLVAVGTSWGWGSTRLAVFDTVTGEEIAPLFEREDYWMARSLVFSPDGRHLVAGGGSIGKGHVEVYDVTSWDLGSAFGHRDSEIDRCLFSPSGTGLAAGDGKRIGVWRFPELEPLIDLDESGSLCWPEEGVLIGALAQGSGFGLTRGTLVVKRWSVPSGTEIDRRELDLGEDFGATLSADGRRLACTFRQRVSILDPADLAEPLVLGSHGSDIRSIAFSPDGARLATGGWDHTLVLWDTGWTGAASRGHERRISTVAFTPAGDRIATGSEDRTIRLWSAETGDETLVIPGPDATTRLLFSPDGSRMLTCAAWTRFGTLWDAATGKPIANLGSHADQVLACALSPDGRRAATGSWMPGGGQLFLWDAVAGGFVAGLTGHRDSVKACAFTTDGARLVSLSQDGLLAIWDAETGEGVSLVEGVANVYLAHDLAPDGRRIAVAGRDHLVRIVDLASGEVVRELGGYEGDVVACAHGSHGERLVTASTDRLIRLWDVESGEEIARARLDEQPDWIRLSPDSSRIVVRDLRTLRLWDADRLSELALLRRSFATDMDVTDVAFSPDGRLLAFATAAGWVEMRKAGDGSPVASYPTSSGAILAWHPAGSSLAAGDSGGNFHILRLEDAASEIPQ